jgi:lipopolysaccharide export system protein LptC
MNIRKYASGILFAVLSLIASSWYYKEFKPVLSLDKKSLLASVDSTATDLVVRQYDASGQLTNLLTTPKMEHIPKDNVNLLKTPHITVTQKDEPSWEIQSLKAKSIAGGQKVIFMQQVIVRQNPDAKTQASTLRTEEVTYFPKEKKATTDLFVTFEQPGNLVESMGMNAYLDEKRVELLNGAKGSYDPSNHG